MAPNPERSYLERVVMEIMETERMYVQDLHSIVEDYLAHIIDTADLPLVPEQVCALFGNIEDIYELNSELLQELDLCKNDPVAIARCFVLKRDYFEIYTQYCTNYPNSVAALTECMRNKTLLTFFMERQEALQHPLPLGSYLLKPVQRILKYHLLLQEIAKHFDPDGEGYEVVEEAINTMTEVAWYINTMKRKHEHAVRLQEVQSLLINWRGPDLTTYGELVLEGTFRFHHTKNNRTLFLFERILLITKRRGENFIYKSHISCSMLMLMEGTKDSLCFSVTHYKHPKQPHTVQARTMEEKKLWTHHIKRLILENHHTIIPQKAKEVILEMDPMYQKYRFNSERKKKTQSDDFTHTRQSELTKQMLKNNKAMLKHSLSEGELRESLIALSSASVAPQDREDEENKSETDDVITEDFSSSMISCWSFRAKALLQLDLDEEWHEHGEAQLPRQEERRVCEAPDALKASPNIFKLQNNTQDTKGSKSLSDCERAQIRPGVCRVSARGKSEQYEVKADVVLNQDGQSSEEEAEDDCAESHNRSILPSSVLDKAGVIVEHFIANARRSSIAPEEHRSPQHEVASREEAGSGPGRNVCRRRDSTLSKQERLLIDKIRNYYENAEQQDEGFSLKRRESLSYIPSGLVSTSVSLFNKIPHTERKGSITETSLVTSEIHSDPDWRFRHVPGSEIDGSQTRKPDDHSEERFCSSADMIKVWQEMEREVIGENKSRETPRFKAKSCFSTDTRAVPADDLTTIVEESPIKSKAEGNEKEATERVVSSLRKKFSENVQGEDAIPPSWRRGSDTSVNTGKPRLTLPLPCAQTTQDVRQTPTSSSSSARLLSPDRLHLKSPVVPLESFSWPDVSELRSKYTSLECTSFSPAAETLSPGCSSITNPSRVHRAGSLDQKLGGFGWTHLPNRKASSDYCISGQAVFPNNNMTITVLEKTNTQTPPSREQPSLLSVTERCRLYEDLDEAALRTEPDGNKSDKRSNAMPQGVVKNLREKFQSLQ